MAISLRKVWSLARDPVMPVLIVYTFTLALWVAATAQPDTLSRAALAIVDEDQSPLSLRIRNAYVPPQFMAPELITLDQADARLDRGRATFVLVIPAGFQRRVLAGRAAALQLSVDATRMNQAFTGSAYVRQIALGEVATFLQGVRMQAVPPVELSLRARFNPALKPTGAALIREREHGTVEHLLVMPVRRIEIMLAKLWSMASVVLLATTPRESIPWLLRELMLLAPTTHFVELSQAILFRGAGLDVVWRPFLALLGIGGLLFGASLARFGRAMRMD